MNQGRDFRERITPQKIGKIIAALGVQTTQIRGLANLEYSLDEIVEQGDRWCPMSPDLQAARRELDARQEPAAVAVESGVSEERERNTGGVAEDV